MTPRFEMFRSLYDSARKKREWKFWPVNVSKPQTVFIGKAYQMSSQIAFVRAVKKNRFSAPSLYPICDKVGLRDMT